MLSMGLTFPSPRNGATSSASTTKGGYESPIKSDEDDEGDEEDDTDSTGDEEEGTEAEARVEISRPAMTQSRMQERFQFSRLPAPTITGCQNLQGTYRYRK